MKEFIEQIDANGTSAILVGIFVVLGFLKRLVKLFFNLIALGAGGLASIWGHNNGFTLANQFVETPAPWMKTGVAVIAFLLVFALIRTALKFLTGQSAEGTQCRSLGFGLPGGLVGLLIGGGLCYGLLSGVRYGGTLAELEHLKDYVNGHVEKSAHSPMLSRLKKWIDRSAIGQWHQKVDFLNNEEEAQLAKIAIVKEGKDQVAKAIVVLDDSIPSALPVDEDLEQVIETGDFATLLKKAKELGVDVEAEKILRLNIEKALGLQQ